jgi:hypothetical protein
MEVTSTCNVISDDSKMPIPNIFGIGMGYSLKTSDMSLNAEMRPFARADSVGVYFK